MPIKLLPNRVEATLTPEQIAAFIAKLREARAIIVPTPHIPDEEFTSMEKMGDVRREESKATIKVFQDHSSFLPEHLTMPHTVADVTLYDQLGTDIIPEVQHILVDDLLRLRAIAGAEALNTLRKAEERAYNDAADGVEEAVKARDRIEKLPRSTDKKGGQGPKAPQEPPK